MFDNNEFSSSWTMNKFDIVVKKPFFVICYYFLSQLLRLMFSCVLLFSPLKVGGIWWIYPFFEARYWICCTHNIAYEENIHDNFFVGSTFNTWNDLNKGHFQPKDFWKLPPPDLTNCPERRKYQDSSYNLLRRKRSRNIVLLILTIILFLHIIEGYRKLKLFWLNIRGGSIKLFKTPNPSWSR